MYHLMILKPYLHHLKILSPIYQFYVLLPVMVLIFHLLKIKQNYKF